MEDILGSASMLDRRRSGWGNYQRQTCKACGAPDKFDFYVSDEVWRAVVPTSLLGSVVCLGCFDDMARDKGVKYATSLRVVYFAGDAATLRLTVSEIT